MKYRSDLIPRTLQLWIDTFQFDESDPPDMRRDRLEKYLIVEKEKTAHKDNLDDSDVFTRIDELVKKIPENKLDQ